MKVKIAVLVLLFIALVSNIAAVYLYFQGKKSSEAQESASATINGTFDINGVVPAGGSITLIRHPYNLTEQPTIIASNLPVIDKSPWSFTTATIGASYELQAQVVVNGTVVASSSPIDVTAPADEEVLTLNIESTQQAAPAAISGTIEIDGYIPVGSTITVQGRKLGAQQFSPVAQNLPGQPRQFLTYTTATSGTTYEVQGTLFDQNGKTIGTSNLLTVTAPALNEQLVINSSAQAPLPTPTHTPIVQPSPTAPPQAIAISGSINFNGAAPANSRIVIFQKQQNISNYQVAVDNIVPTDGATWSWNSPTNATWYTLIAILKQRQNDGTDKDISSSSPVTIAAPAASILMTINSGFSLSAPGGQISVSCQSYNGGPNQNIWSVAVNFPPVDRAGSYWFQVGTSNGASDTVNTANQTNTVYATFKNSTTYYARYAYATVPVAPLGSSQYSGFSSTTALQCSH